MDIKNKKVLALGGTGLIGEEIVKKLFAFNCSVQVVSLGSETDDETFSRLNKLDSSITYVKGNIFLPTKYKDGDFNQLLKSKTFLKEYLDLVFLKRDYRSFFLYDILQKTKPDIVIDAVNSATVLSYTENMRLIQNYLQNGEISVSEFIASLSIPRLIHFFNCLYHSLLETPSCKIYLKIGTTGTGGMGFNIPYTHGETKPSYPLLEKAAVSGAYSSLLFVLAQTFGLPQIKEIKPAALVGYKEVNYGKIYLNKNRSDVLKVYEFKDFQRLKLDPAQKIDFQSLNHRPKGTFEAVFVDTGENGQFSLEEFRTIANKKQMGFITKEEIADVVIRELNGEKTGKDIINALNKTVMGSSESAQKIKEIVIVEMEKMQKEKNMPSLAFEILGPPRLAKLIFEAYLIKEKTGFMKEKLYKISFDEDSFDNKAKSLILSCGVPILFENNILLIGKLPSLTVGQKNVAIDEMADAGWVDLRKSNLLTWKKRLSSFGKSSKVEIGDIVAWILEKEDLGFRKETLS